MAYYVTMSNGLLCQPYYVNLLTMRTQSVCTNGVVSEPQPISFGVL